MEKAPLHIVGRKTSANPTTRNCLLNGLASVLSTAPASPALKASGCAAASLQRTSSTPRSSLCRRSYSAHCATLRVHVCPERMFVSDKEEPRRGWALLQRRPLFI